MIHIGIDPGKSGGLCYIRSGDGEPDDWDTTKMPETETDIGYWFEEVSESLREDGEQVFEKVGSMPVNAARAMLTFGTNYGFLRACLICNKIPFEEVLPLKWQSGLGIVKRKKTETKTQFKNRLKAKAQSLFPHLKINLSNCDGLLIAEFNRRTRERNF